LIGADRRPVGHADAVDLVVAGGRLAFAGALGDIGVLALDSEGGAT
jgi:hypothetical protein